VLFCVVTADWFTAKLETDFGITCSTPRLRKSYSALTYAEKETYIKTIFQMKLSMDAWKKGDTRTQIPLYNTFVQMHNNQGNGRNGIWHYTSLFPFAHKAFLWLYESALIYTAVNNSFITPEQACCWGIPYWPWETSYDYDTTDTVIPYMTSSVFSDSDLNGDATPDATTGYVDTGYFAKPQWVLAYPTKPKNSVTADGKAKRLMADPKSFNLDPSQLIRDMTARPKFADFLIYLHGTAHNNMHNFLGYSMSSQASPDEPMFFMHHCNIDRLFHFWADCLEYDKVDANSLTPTQYSPVNPTDANMPSPHTVYTDDTKATIADTSLDAFVPLYVSGSGQFKYCISTEFPQVRQMWSMGTPDQKGWNGLYYRYGPDAMADNSLSVSNCKAGNTWTWVNQYGGSSKRSEHSEMGTPEEIWMYQNLSMKFENFQKEGMTPKEALEALAMESCECNPQQPLTEESFKSMIMMGIDPRTTRRICDKEISLEGLESMDMASSFK